VISAEAWVLRQGEFGSHAEGRLERETIAFDDLRDDEALAEPIYGCWEANMTHALRRKPADVCRLRCEKKVVLGNAGVVRVTATGKCVRKVKEGDLCTLVPVAQLDPHGYMLKVFGYDAPGTIGMLAKRTKLREEQLSTIPYRTRFALSQWAASSVRFATAWDNWKVAYACWRVQMPEAECPPPVVWGWGGGVALAELLLAKRLGCRVAMTASCDKRLALLDGLGIDAIDRRQFPALSFDEARFGSDGEYRLAYIDSERRFLAEVRRRTDGERVSIFIDNIGTPVFRATLKALARQGVITTAGWDQGWHTGFSRIEECIQRHIHVHTHGARASEACEAAAFAERTGWMPPLPDRIYGWEEIPILAEQFGAGAVDSYFPVFEVNAPPGSRD
jgi:NADPH:quinone reductase-like Zn-dependent oxidoreductase